MNAFDMAVRKNTGKSLCAADAVAVLQVNLGLLCNMACCHCHVEASPSRTEEMSRSTMGSVLALAGRLKGALLDLTGGAPELNPDFVWFVRQLRGAGHQVQVRTNLSVFLEPGMESLPAFYKEMGVSLVASLPCYLDKNVAAQRGEGVMAKSVEAIRRLNALGYGLVPELPLSLVYNPGGPFLPPDQVALEADYRRELKERYDVVFTRLLTITNMPIGRFMEDLRSRHKADIYQELLKEKFNAQTVEGLMCRHQICVAWDGSLSDCDFNKALGMGLGGGLPHHIDQLDPAVLKARPILTGEHCFGCTAGCGSSCGGALVA